MKLFKKRTQKTTLKKKEEDQNSFETEDCKAFRQLSVDKESERGLRKEGKGRISIARIIKKAIASSNPRKRKGRGRKQREGRGEQLYLQRTSSGGKHYGYKRLRKYGQRAGTLFQPKQKSKPLPEKGGANRLLKVRGCAK